MEHKIDGLERTGHTCEDGETLPTATATTSATTSPATSNSKSSSRAGTPEEEGEEGCPQPSQGDDDAMDESGDASDDEVDDTDDGAIDLDTETEQSLWAKLKAVGWVHRAGTGLQDWLYFRPGAPSLKKGAIMGIDYFVDLRSVTEFCHKHEVDGQGRVGHVDEPSAAQLYVSRGSKSTPAARAGSNVAARSKKGRGPAVSMGSPDALRVPQRRRHGQREAQRSGTNSVDVSDMEWPELWRLLRDHGWTYGSPDPSHDTKGSDPKGNYYLAPSPRFGLRPHFKEEHQVREYVEQYAQIFEEWKELWLLLEKLGWRISCSKGLQAIQTVFCVPGASVAGEHGVAWFKHKSDVRRHLMKYPELLLSSGKLWQVLNKVGWESKNSPDRLRNWCYKPPGGSWTGEQGKEWFLDEDEMYHFVYAHPSLVRPHTDLQEVLADEGSSSESELDTAEAMEGVDGQGIGSGGDSDDHSMNASASRYSADSRALAEAHTAKGRSPNEQFGAPVEAGTLGVSPGVDAWDFDESMKYLDADTMLLDAGDVSCASSLRFACVHRLMTPMNGMCVHNLCFHHRSLEA